MSGTSGPQGPVPPRLPEGYGPPPGVPREQVPQVPRQQQPQPLYGSQPAPEQPAAPAKPYTQKGFFGSLFDLSFDHLVSTKLIRMAYMACIGFTFLVGFMLLMLAWTFSVWNETLAWITLLSIPIVCFFGILGSRLSLEFLINQFKITEELRKLREIGTYATTQRPPYTRDQ